MLILTLDTIFNVKIIDFKGEKTKNPHMGLYRHIDMFYKAEFDPEIDSDHLENYYRPINGENRRWNCLFEG